MTRSLSCRMRPRAATSGVILAGIAAAWMAAGAIASADERGRQDDGGWRVIHAGGLALPDHADDSTGRRVAVGGLSGVTWLGGASFAAVMDNSDHAMRFTLRLSDAGEPLALDDVRVVTLSAHHDYEDLAPCPAEIGRRLEREDADHATGGPYVFVSEEDTPAIHVVSLASGRLLETRPLPANLRTRRHNRGNESLCIDPRAGHLWTANEEALPADGPPAAVDAGTVVRLTRLPVDVAAAVDARPFQTAYAVDAPHGFARVVPGKPLSGLVALAAIGDGRLLALERSAGPGLPPFASRIFLVDTSRAVDVTTVAGDLVARGDAFLEKRLLWADSLGLNLEGLCLGPRLADGGRAIVCIADNDRGGTPNRVIGLKLVAPPRSVGVTSP